MEFNNSVPNATLSTRSTNGWEELTIDSPSPHQRNKPLTLTNGARSVNGPTGRKVGFFCAFSKAHSATVTDTNATASSRQAGATIRIGGFKRTRHGS